MHCPSSYYFCLLVVFKLTFFLVVLILLALICNFLFVVLMLFFPYFFLAHIFLLYSNHMYRSLFTKYIQMTQQRKMKSYKGHWNTFYIALFYFQSNRLENLFIGTMMSMCSLFSFILIFKMFWTCSCLELNKKHKYHLEKKLKINSEYYNW